MFIKYLLYFLNLTTIFSAIEDQKVNDCLEGEIWYEWCQECKCFEEGNKSCQWHSFNCLESFFSVEHFENVTVFSGDRRCHYSRQKDKTICVRLTYQKDMNGTWCMEDSYFYDNCTFCKCDLRALKYFCHFTDDNLKTNGGVCNPEQGIIENFCYECFCTFTRFRFCTLSELCRNRKEKPGKCPIMPHFYSQSVQDFCTFVRYQECYTDYGCSGIKKCCRVADCFLRCVNPM